jgi:hypothetical protein
VTCCQATLKEWLLAFKGCAAVADFWREIGNMSKTDALLQLEKFFYQGLEHNSVQLPAAINFTVIHLS